MADLRKLYQEAILDHYRNPRNFCKLEHANRQAEGYNPLCGDRCSLYLQVEEGVIHDIGFIGMGCAISTASASMMTECLKGKTVAEAEAIFESFQNLVSGDSAANADIIPLGMLAAFSSIREYPVRVKCAILAWHTMQAALEGRKETIATE